MSNSTAENPLSLRNFSIVNKTYHNNDGHGASSLSANSATVADDVSIANVAVAVADSSSHHPSSNSRRRRRYNYRRNNRHKSSFRSNNPAPYLQERKTLMEYGIHKYYDYHKNSSSSYYKDLNLANHALVFGKVVYVVVKGTSIMFIFPYDLLITHDWFNNMLGNSGFKSNRIDLPTDNILLPIDCPIPLRFYLVYNVIMSGDKMEYSINSELNKLKEMFDYYGMDLTI